jgi:hypothetical protein
MKIRIGFVSNSSSSSFVAIIDSKAYENAFKIAHPYTKAVITQLEPKKATVAGNELVIISTYIGQSGETPFETMEIDELPPGLDMLDGETYDDYGERCVDYSELIDPADFFDEFLESIPEGMIFQKQDYN